LSASEAEQNRGSIFVNFFSDRTASHWCHP
jgi:hypothetical protein